MTETKNVYFGLRVPEAEFQLWKARATKEHRSIAMLVRLAVGDRIQESTNAPGNGNEQPAPEEL